MRKKVFFRVFCFTALAVIATVVLITLALTVAHGDTGALTGAIIRKELRKDMAARFAQIRVETGTTDIS